MQRDTAIDLIRDLEETTDYRAKALIRCLLKNVGAASLEEADDKVVFFTLSLFQKMQVKEMEGTT